MAVITISNTGGNYNATASWVGGVVPLTTDTIATTGTSGQLTINVASSIAGVDFTNYTSTLTINAELFVTGPIVLVNTMTISGTTYLVASGTSTIRTNGCVIPWFRVSGINTTRTFLDNATITNLGQSLGNQNPATAGSFTMSVTNFRQIPSGGGSYGWLLGTVAVVFNGANCYYENDETQSGILAPTFINTAGNFTIAGSGSNVGQIATGTFNTSQNGSGQLIYQNGTITGNRNISIYYGNLNNTLGVRFDTGSMSNTWSNIFIKDAGNITAASNNIINLTSPLKFDNMFLTEATTLNYSVRRPLRFTGTSVLQGGTFSAQSVMTNNSTTNIQTFYPAEIQFTSGGITHSFTNLNIIGMPNSKSSISTTTASTIGLSFSNVLLYTDVSYGRAPVTTYVFGATISNSVNFATASIGSGGGGESSYTFVN